MRGERGLASCRCRKPIAPGNGSARPAPPRAKSPHHQMGRDLAPPLPTGVLTSPPPLFWPAFAAVAGAFGMPALGSLSLTELERLHSLWTPPRYNPGCPNPSVGNLFIIGSQVTAVRIKERAICSPERRRVWGAA